MRNDIALLSYRSSCVMITSWKFSCSLLVIMMLRRASAKLALFSASRLVVGSSSARMPQFRQKVSASAKRMIRHASTCMQWTFGCVLTQLVTAIVQNIASCQLCTSLYLVARLLLEPRNPLLIFFCILLTMVPTSYSNYKCCLAKYQAQVSWVVWKAHDIYTQEGVCSDHTTVVVQTAQGRLAWAQRTVALWTQFQLDIPDSQAST